MCTQDAAHSRIKDPLPPPGTGAPHLRAIWRTPFAGCSSLLAPLQFAVLYACSVVGASPWHFSHAVKILAGSDEPPPDSWRSSRHDEFLPPHQAPGSWRPSHTPGGRPPCIPPRAPCGLLRQATGAPCAAPCSPLCGCTQHAHPAPLGPCSPPSAKAASCDAMELPFLSKVHGESTFMQGQCHGRLELFRSSTSISSSMTLRSSPMEGHRRRPSDGGGRMMLTGWRLLLCCMV